MPAIRHAAVIGATFRLFDGDCRRVWLVGRSLATRRRDRGSWLSRTSDDDSIEFVPLEVTSLPAMDLPSWSLGLQSDESDRSMNLDFRSWSDTLGCSSDLLSPHRRVDGLFRVLQGFARSANLTIAIPPNMNLVALLSCHQIELPSIECGDGRTRMIRF
jgi:hypothetical protein